MSLDPLGRERVLKCLCYHGMDLCLGCRETPFRHYPTDQRSQKHAPGEKISGYYVYSPERCCGCHALAGSWEDRKWGRTMHGTLEAILAQLRAGLEALYGP